MQHTRTFLARLCLGGLSLSALFMVAACSLPAGLPGGPPAPAPGLTTTPMLSATPSSAGSGAAPSASQTPIASLTPDQPPIPDFSHVYVIVMENKEYATIVGQATAPYLNTLIAQYGLAENYTGVTHPSQPNYFALFSGSTQGVTDDGVYDLNGQNLADQIEASGKTWRVFAENVPANCFTGAVALNREDGLGFYARKHNPAISFVSISSSSARCASITSLTDFDLAAADYALVIPNLCHDMHDCSVTAGDDFLKAFVPKILDSQAWQERGVLFITWDEGSTSVGGGGHVPLLVISKQVPAAFRSAAAHNHYSLLRTIEDGWALGCLNQACVANNLGEFFR